MADKIIAALAEGKSVAQVSDAGTPAVCDPGAKLAARVREAGFKVVPVAGASAVMAALSVAGVSEPDFYFNGFLPPKAGERQKLLAKWLEADYPVVMLKHRTASKRRWPIWLRFFPSAKSCWRAKSPKRLKPF